jgi:ABC-2 type transport system ATP-binding protein
MFTPGELYAKLRRMSAPALRINNLAKSYASAAALTGLSLEIGAGEFFGLVGENGAGKTTLIKCALDFCDISGGSIEIFGTPHRQTAARSRLAFLPERFTPPYYLSGRDFLRYTGELHRRPYDEARARAMLDALELAASALDKPVRAYSKGMTQKLGLAACLLSEKDLYILDEPTSGLDPKARALLKSELKAQHAAGRTVVMTTHALYDVGEMCDRMAVIHRGELRFAGTPDEFVTHYAAPDLEHAYLACIADR